MEYIDTGAALAAAAAALAGCDLVAVDTEAAGYHRYSDRVCLVQISSRDRTYVIDALAVPRPGPLRALLEDAGVEVVIHDAAYDLRLLARDSGVAVRGLFDTAIAAQFLGERQTGLANLVENHLGVQMEKEHQLADWAQRPLPRELMEYAAEDTRHLPQLRDRLVERLRSLGRDRWADEEFRIQEAAARWDEDDAEPFRRLKGSGRLRPRGLAALRELYDWREDEARARDRAPFRVLPNRMLVELARRRPATRGALASVPRMRKRWVDRYGSALLAALDRARALPRDRLPSPSERPPRPPRDPETERLVDRLRGVRGEAAEALGIDPGFLMPRSRLERIARARPRSAADLAAVPGTRDWQIEAVGANILAALRTE